MSDTHRNSEIVGAGETAVETYVAGTDPALVVLPSYGRDGGQDYDDIAARVADAGWRVLRPQPRGIGRPAR